MKLLVVSLVATFVLAGCGRIEYPGDVRPLDTGPMDSGLDAPDAADAPDPCTACGDCEICVSGICQPAADGTSCADGVCLSGACCTPACDGIACGDDSCGGVCGTCDAGERCESGACEMTICMTDVDCLECERCEDNACLPLTDGTSCTDGLCYGGACCDGCYNGVACQTGDTITACGASGDACTGCGIPPNSTASCPSGTCEYACMAGYADCNTDPADGCEVDTATDRAHCGACAMACAGECRTCAAGSCDPAVDGTPCTDGMCASGSCVVDPCRTAAGVGMDTCRLLTIEHTAIGSNGFGRVWRGQDIAFSMPVVVTGLEFMDQSFLGDRMDEIRLMSAVSSLSTLASSTTINSYDEGGFNRWHQATFATPVALTAATEYTAWFHLTSTASPTRGCDLTTVDPGWGGHHTDSDPDGLSAGFGVEWNYQFGTNIRVYGYVP